MNVIFRLSQGALLAHLVHELPLMAARSAERLYDVSTEVAKYRERGITRYTDDDAIFELEVLPTLDDAAGNLYRTYVLRDLGEGEAERVAEELSGSMYVDYAQLDEENVLYTAPNDPDYSGQWGLPRIDCESAWARSQGEDIVVAVVDTGVDYTSGDLAPNMWRNAAGKHGYDFSNNTSDPKDYEGHGTHVAGIIAAVANNATQIAGVAPKAKIMAVRVFPNAYDSRCAAGIKYAVDNGARVINNSWGPSGRRPTNAVVEDAIAYAYGRGVIVVFAAGNANDDVQHYAPANSTRVLSVAATTSTDARASYSNYGAVTIAAPGSGILSLAPSSSQSVLKSGTSMAAPFVAGAVALYIKLNPQSSTFDIIRRKLQASADAITTDKPIAKRLNAGRFVAKVPDSTKHVQEPVSRGYSGVSGCAGRAADEAMIALRLWRDQLPGRFPGYVVVSAHHLGGTARTTSGQDWDGRRWCRTIVSITCAATLRAAGAAADDDEVYTSTVVEDML